MKNTLLGHLGLIFIVVSKITIISIILFFLTNEVIKKDDYYKIPLVNKNSDKQNLIKVNKTESLKKEIQQSFFIPIKLEITKNKTSTKKSENPIKPTQINNKTVNSLLPIRVKIPAINVDAKLENVGLTKKGIVGIPKGFSNAAWLNTSPIPGEIGTSIIDGHFGYIRGVPAVFNNLGKLKKGDKIYIEYAEKEIIFIVRELNTYKQTGDSSVLFGTDDGQSHLNIITCNGVWDKKIKNYSDRLIVFSDKEIQ